MLASRVSAVTDNASRRAGRGDSSSSQFNTRVRTYLQDTYDLGDDDEQSNDTSFDNFYDAQTDTQSGVPEVRINMDPSDRLVEAIDQLRGAVLENTNAQNKSRRGRTSANTAQVQYKSDGTRMTLKDDKLKIRKEKVSTCIIIYLILLKHEHQCCSY